MPEPVHESGQLGMNVLTLDEPMPSVRAASASVPDELAAVIDRCLAKPVDARMHTAQALLDALEPLQPTRAARGLRADQRPYAGLGAVQEADAGRFFGRARDIAAACARLRDQPLLGVVGASGVGKSSFVRAGIVPGLQQSGEAWTSLVLRPGRAAENAAEAAQRASRRPGRACLVARVDGLGHTPLPRPCQPA